MQSRGHRRRWCETRCRACHRPASRRWAGPARCRASRCRTVPPRPRSRRCRSSAAPGRVRPGSASAGHRRCRRCGSCACLPPTRAAPGAPSSCPVRPSAVPGQRRPRQSRRRMAGGQCPSGVRRSSRQKPLPASSVRRRWCAGSSLRGRRPCPPCRLRQS